MHDHTQQLIAATLKAADPFVAVQRHVRYQDGVLQVGDRAYRLIDFDEVVLIAAGKAAEPMARAVMALVESHVRRGVIATKYQHATSAIHPLQTIESAHPVPDENSLRAGEAIYQMLTQCTSRSLVLACISGGASAIVVAPPAPIRLSTLRAINEALLRSGADINEMNAVRSRIDRLKGGGVVRSANGATVVGLILSDVIGDPLDVIASGMTNDARAHNVLVGNNTQACEAAAEMARELGYRAEIVTTQMRGEARDQAVEIVRQICLQPSNTPTALIFGGETTVTLCGDGKGGRNQELALAAAIELDFHKSDSTRHTIIALGTDGTDGPTDAAGAIARDDTLTRARELRLDAHDALMRNDSYPFFERLGDLIMTGATGTNVADVVIALSSPVAR
jgi:hydroxypyruvate reductase